MIKLLLFSTISGVLATRPLCPPSELLKPCGCYFAGIFCADLESIDLKSIFNKLNINKSISKEYGSFRIRNSTISEIPSNVFGDITFDKIYIENCDNLVNIDENAFTKSEEFINDFQISNNRKLTSTSVFKIVNKLKALKTLRIDFNGITDIPSHAIQAIGFNSVLTDIYIRGKSLAIIGENAFFNLNSLKRLYLFDTSIEYLPKNIVSSEKPTDQSLDLKIEGPFIKGFKISVHAFDSMKRPTSLTLSYGNYNFHGNEYIDENIFREFLLQNTQNRLDVGENQECKDPRNDWFKNNDTIRSRIKLWGGWHDQCSKESTTVRPKEPKGSANSLRLNLITIISLVRILLFI